MESRRKRICIALLILALLLGAGTLAFHMLEEWTLIDSFYFTGVTLSTIGYGDLVPKTELGKLFTVFFSFSAIGIAFYCISVLAESRTLIVEESKKLRLPKGIKINGFAKKKHKHYRIRLSDEED